MRKNKFASGVNAFLKIVVIVFFIFPFLWMVSTALQTYLETQASPPTLIPRVPQWINFAAAMEAGPFLTYAKNSVVTTFSVMAIQFLVMVPAAYAFAKYEFRGKGILFACILLAFMVPGQITFIPIYLTMSDWGLLNTLWPQIIPFMADAFGIFWLRQFFMQIPTTIIEAARIDGAGEGTILWRIMVPMAVPALATTMLFSFVSRWNSYFWPLVMTNRTELRNLPLGIQMLQSSEGVQQWNVVMAGNVVLILPILIFYLFCSKYIVKSFTGVSLK